MKKLMILMLALISLNCFSQTIGLMPFDSAKKCDIHVSRKVVYANTFNGGSAYTDTILLNVDNNFNHTYTTDTAKFKKQLKNINATLNPTLIAIENEELLTGDIVVYCNELRAAVKAVPGKVTNGGLTVVPLAYWYWSKTHDSDFFTYNIVQKSALLAGDKDSEIAKVDYELSQLQIIPVRYVNVHYYFKYDNQVPGLIRMINYVAQWVGKPVISNEAGIYSEGLWPQVVYIAQQTGMDYLIGYSGNGYEGQVPAKALPLSCATILNE